MRKGVLEMTWAGGRRLTLGLVALGVLTLSAEVSWAQPPQPPGWPEAWVMLRLDDETTMVVAPGWSVQAPRVTWDGRARELRASGPGCVYTDTVWNARIEAEGVRVEGAGGAGERVVVEKMSFGQAEDLEPLDSTAER